MRKLAIVVSLTGALAMVASAESKIFQIQHADVRSLANILNIFDAKIIVEPSLHTIAVSAPDSIMPAIEDAIARFDVPPEPEPNILVTFYMLTSGQGSEVPPELESVATQLGSLFHLNELTLLDTAVLRAGNGREATAAGSVDYNTGEGPSSTAPYTLRFSSATVRRDGDGNVIHLTNLRMGIRIPYATSATQFQYQDVGFTTDIHIGEGQKVVVGKANVGKEQDHLILVVTAEVVK